MNGTPEPKPRLSTAEYLRRLQELGARVVLDSKGGVEITGEHVAGMKPTKTDPPVP
jgi:hypothetical protein